MHTRFVNWFSGKSLKLLGGRFLSTHLCSIHNELQGSKRWTLRKSTVEVHDIGLAPSSHYSIWSFRQVGFVPVQRGFGDSESSSENIQQCWMFDSIKGRRSSVWLGEPPPGPVYHQTPTHSVLMNHHPHSIRSPPTHSGLLGRRGEAHTTYTCLAYHSDAQPDHMSCVPLQWIMPCIPHIWFRRLSHPTWHVYHSDESTTRMACVPFRRVTVCIPCVRFRRATCLVCHSDHKNSHRHHPASDHNGYRMH